MQAESNLYLLEITNFLDRFFTVDRYILEERGGTYIPSTRPIKTLGLALEPWAELKQWAIANEIDALFLHRPWKLSTEQLPPDVGVISYHLPFDEHLTISFNPQLAKALAMSDLEILGEKQGRAIGMIGNIPTQTPANLYSCINQIFGGYEQVLAAPKTEIARVAIVGAMTDLLVREAAIRGADVYITGQVRQPALKAIQATQIGTIAVGHHRSEVWGLRSLAGILNQRWNGLKVVVPC